MASLKKKFALVVGVGVAAAYFLTREPEMPADSIPSPPANVPAAADDGRNEENHPASDVSKTSLPAAMPAAIPLVMPAVTAATVQARSAAPESSAPLVPLSKLVPSLARSRKEVSENPHVPPASGLEFTLLVADRAEHALASEDASADFLSELEACALAKDTVTAVRAICLQTANDLAERYPHLKTRAEAMFRAAEPAAASIASQIK